MLMTREAKLSRQPAYTVQARFAKSDYMPWLVQSRFRSFSHDNSGQGACHLTGYNPGTNVPDGSTAK